MLLNDLGVCKTNGPLNVDLGILGSFTRGYSRISSEKTAQSGKPTTARRAKACGGAGVGGVPERNWGHGEDRLCPP